ncbi:hypothetical protein BSKO_12889 [Bryopsis sp. KO-2023]|nr:hypothetical protein BSKO_12889 [Bryopsis sp. KO-2023]
MSSSAVVGNGASRRVSGNAEASPQTNAQPRPGLNQGEHIAVQLVPIDREAEAVIRQTGNNPHLELNISPMKPLLVAIFFILDKWKLSDEKRGSLFITPPLSVCPALLKGIRWTEKDTDPTLKIIDIHGFLKRPSPFRLSYGVRSSPTKIPRAVREKDPIGGVPTPTRGEPRLPMADVDILSLPSLDNSTTLQQPIDMDVLMDTIRSVAENDEDVNPDKAITLKLTGGSSDANQTGKPGPPSTTNKANETKTTGKGRRGKAAKTPKTKPKPKVAKKPTKRAPAARKPRKTVDSKKTSVGNPVSVGQVALCPGWWANSMALGSGQGVYNPLMYSAARALQMQSFPGQRIPPGRTLIDPNGQEVVGGWAVMPAMTSHQGAKSQEMQMPLVVNGTPQEECKNNSAIDRFYSFVGRPGTVSDEEVNRLWQGLVSEDNA